MRVRLNTMVHWNTFNFLLFSKETLFISTSVACTTMLYIAAINLISNYESTMLSYSEHHFTFFSGTTLLQLSIWNLNLVSNQHTRRISTALVSHIIYLRIIICHQNAPVWLEISLKLHHFRRPSGLSFHFILGESVESKQRRK